MARPQALQFLRHGKALCQAVFGGFVETWNYVVRRTDAICGDGDLVNGDGLITVDNTDPERPIIRLDKSQLPKGGGGGAGAVYPGCFDIDGDHFLNPYVIVGNVVATIPVSTFTAPAGGVVAVSVYFESNEWTGELVTYASVAALVAAQKTATNMIVPLYEFDANGEIICDFRGAPRLQAWELGV